MGSNLRIVLIFLFSVSFFGARTVLLVIQLRLGRYYQCYIIKIILLPNESSQTWSRFEVIQGTARGMSPPFRKIQYYS